MAKETFDSLLATDAILVRVYIISTDDSKVARAGAGLKSKVAYLGGIVWR